MNYSTLNFLGFAGAAALVYFLFPKKFQWTVLLAASYVFMLFAGWQHAAFLLGTTLIVYGAGVWMESIAAKAKAQLALHKDDWDRTAKKDFKAQVQKKKRAVMLVAVILALGVLCFLKYYNFLAGSLSEALGLSLPTFRLLLPLGLSFYTFQAVGYVLDVYREKIHAQRNPARVALFLSFFPQIVQGPISFYDQLAHQLYEPHRFSYTRAVRGGELILWGFFKKLVIADRAFIIIRTVLEDYQGYSSTVQLIIVLLYALQLYTDFSGGIDISRGVAQILGIDMVQNFRRPYFATDINDYWRRWHISLGAWMKEYVFYPLALSRRFAQLGKKIRATGFGKTAAGQHIAKVLPTSLASLIVFLLVGVWHGANWKYVGFGLWNGGVIMLSTLLEPLFVSWAKKLHINVQSFGFRLFQMLRTFVVVLIGYVFDIAPTLSAALSSIGLMITGQNFAQGGADIMTLGLTDKDFWVLGICTLILLVVSILQERKPDESLRERLAKKPFILRYALIFLCVVAIAVFGVYGYGFDPVDFVYMQF